MMKLTLIGVLIAVGLVAALGLYLFGLGIRNVRRAAASSRWPRTAGKVVRSETREEHSTGRSIDGGPRTSSVIYSADTVIEYEAGGKRYTTNLIHFGQTLGSGDSSEAELQRLRYPVGGEVSVSYDPSQPWVAAARPGLHAEAFWLPGAGLAFLLPAVLAGFVFLTIFRNAPQQQRNDDEFRKSVEAAIDAGRRGVAPPDMPIRPPKDESDAIVPVVAGLFGALFFGLGILALSSGAQRLSRGAASERWPSVEGKVLSAKANTSAAQEEDGGSATTSSPPFVYTYEVGGVKHFNNLRRFAHLASSDEGVAAEVAARYPAGKTVRVHYYPADPDVAVLEPGNNSEGLWLPGIGLVALLGGLATLIWIVPAMAK